MVMLLSRRTKPRSRAPRPWPHYRLGGRRGPWTTWTLASCCLSWTLPWPSNAIIPHFPFSLLEEGTNVIITVIVKVSFTINVGTPRLCKNYRNGVGAPTQ